MLSDLRITTKKCRFDYVLKMTYIKQNFFYMRALPRTHTRWKAGKGRSDTIFLYVQDWLLSKMDKVRLLVQHVIRQWGRTLLRAL